MTYDETIKTIEDGFSQIIDEIILFQQTQTAILKNDNLTYKIEDIHKFLKKENEHYNFRTVAYLISEQNYDRRKLLELGIKKDTVEQALKTIPIKARLRYCLCNTVFKAIQIRNILFKSLNVVKCA